MDNILQLGGDQAPQLRPSNSIDTDLSKKYKKDSMDQGISRKHTLYLSILQNIYTVVIRKMAPGFSKDCVQALDRLFTEVEAGRLGELKFVVMDLAHADDGAEAFADGVERLMERLIDLVVASPVITIAWARGSLQGADLEFALRCSALIADPAARFSFDCAPERIGGLYAALTRRLGLVQAERLLDAGETLDAPTMRDLCLVKALVETSEGLEAIKTFLAGYARRYNGNLAILRAQRMAERGQAESSASVRGGRTRTASRSGGSTVATVKARGSG